MLKYRFQVCTKSEGAHFNTVVFFGGGWRQKGGFHLLQASFLEEFCLNSHYRLFQLYVSNKPKSTLCFSLPVTRVCLC